MKNTVLVAAMIGMCAGIGLAHADSDKPKMKPAGAPGGAEQSARDAGVARDPAEVKEQSGNTKASPGTVGAAPGADTKSQGAGH